MKILLVEDETELLKSIAEGLSTIGYYVDTTSWVRKHWNISWQKNL